MPQAIILGAGMVGSVMAADLAQDSDMTVAIADRSAKALSAAQARAGKPITLIEADLSDPAAVKRSIEPFDLVLGALPSAFGFQALRAVLECSKPYCDISFMPEEALQLDELAKQHSVTAITDCGVAPGMSNLLAGYGAARLDSVERIEIYVGGLPRSPQPPFRYKAAFSPADVVEEYTRPARIVENGEIVTREALSEPELLDFQEVGTLEAFNTDGLRSLAYTMSGIPFMKEKTLRWPGHIDIMRTIRDLGLFGRRFISVEGAKVRPIDVTAALLFPKWTYEEGEEDFTIMRISVEGERAGTPINMQWDLLDSYHRETRTTSMARTTAFPCTILARTLLSPSAHPHGVLVPELIGNDAAITGHVLSELEKRGVTFRYTENPA